MRIALPIHEGKISPVFDWARRLLVVDRVAPGSFAKATRRGRPAAPSPRNNGEREAARREIELDDLAPALRARRLAELGVETLLCGGISAPLAALVEAQGVKVIAGLVGEADAVLDAFFAGGLSDPGFAMPGWRCPGRRTRARRGCGRGRGRGGGRGRRNRQ
jgi:hypothetical protein